MPLEIRAPDASEIEELFHADGRGFGVHFSDEEIKERAPTIDVSRFRVAVEKGKFVGIAGSFEMAPIRR